VHGFCTRNAFSAVATLTHVPSQACAASQAVAHFPQFIRSRLGSTHTPLQLRPTPASPREHDVLGAASVRIGGPLSSANEPSKGSGLGSPDEEPELPEVPPSAPGSGPCSALPVTERPHAAAEPTAATTSVTKTKRDTAWMLAHATSPVLSRCSAAFHTCKKTVRPSVHLVHSRAKVPSSSRASKEKHWVSGRNPLGSSFRAVRKGSGSESLLQHTKRFSHSPLSHTEPRLLLRGDGLCPPT
jgi:hypothetical protein